MEGESPSRRGVVKSRRSGSFYGSLGDYPGISPGPRSRLGDAEDEEGEGRWKRRQKWQLPWQSEPNFPKMMEQVSQLMGQLTQAVSPRLNSRASTFNT
ncbi:hypothetical protein O181_051286 [Austropuccinia psidii MF-1]|uniref:Uncharacterized protein n=1 Tax=Austropuccinia psidii MF-1 TaxID=1389203 RepID=A0A9Q3HN72_9BASI|nr:hypothetical protein [Austropuccinia psidii MF-1]